MEYKILIYLIKIRIYNKIEIKNIKILLQNFSTKKLVEWQTYRFWVSEVVIWLKFSLLTREKTLGDISEFMVSHYILYVTYKAYHMPHMIHGISFNETNLKIIEKMQNYWFTSMIKNVAMSGTRPSGWFFSRFPWWILYMSQIIWLILDDVRQWLWGDNFESNEFRIFWFQ